MWICGIIFIAVTAISVKYGLEYISWLDWDAKFIHNVKPGSCQYILQEDGSEDVTHIGNGLVLISTGFAKGLKTGQPGKLKLLDTASGKVSDLRVRDPPVRADFMVAPHGISVWTDPDSGQQLVYVLTHSLEEDAVEVFETVKPEIGDNYTLQYTKTIRDPRFKVAMNDLLVVGRDQFYITIFYHYRTRAKSAFEILSRRHWGGVLYYDGRRATEVVQGLFLTNGINISPDGSIVYVAEFGNKKLLGYRRTAEGNGLTKAWEMDVDTCLDNIEVDPDTGDLWIGCHPIGYRVIDSLLDFIGYSLPSQVLWMKMCNKMVCEMEEIFADNSSMLMGSSGATYVKSTQKLVIGTVGHKALLCDVEYLS